MERADGRAGQRNPANGRLVIGFSRDGGSVASFDTVGWRLKFSGPPAPSVPCGKWSWKAGRHPARRAFSPGFRPGRRLFCDGRGREDFCLECRERSLAPRPARSATALPQCLALAGRQTTGRIGRKSECGVAVRLRDRPGRQLAGHRDFVSGLAFSPDGSTLATGSEDGTIRLWNTTNGNMVAALPGHLQETTDVAFSPDGRTLASLARGESLKLWHVPTLREVVSQNEADAGAWLRFSPDGSRLAFDSGTNTLNFLSAPPRKKLCNGCGPLLLITLRTAALLGWNRAFAKRL